MEDIFWLSGETVQDAKSNVRDVCLSDEKAAAIVDHFVQLPVAERLAHIELVRNHLVTDQTIVDAIKEKLDMENPRGRAAKDSHLRKDRFSVNLMRLNVALMTRLSKSNQDALSKYYSFYILGIKEEISAHMKSDFLAC